MITDEFMAGSAAIGLSAGRSDQQKNESHMMKELRSIGNQIQRACAEEIKTQSSNALKDMKRELRMLVQDLIKEQMQRPSTHEYPQVGPEPPAAIPMAFPPPIGPNTNPVAARRSRQSKGGRLNSQKWDAAFKQPQAPQVPADADGKIPPLPNEVPDTGRQAYAERQGRSGSKIKFQDGLADAGAGGLRVGSKSLEKGNIDFDRVDSDGFASDAGSDTEGKAEKPAAVARAATLSRLEGGKNRQTICRRLSLGMHKELMPMVKEPPKPFYKMTAAELLQSAKFDNAIGTLILLNAVTIGWQADYAARGITEDFPWYFITVERVFCGFFFLELVLRMYVQRAKFFCASRKTILWNYFDFLVVAAQLTEEGINIAASTSGVDLGSFRLLRILRVLRLVRILRVVRVLHLIAELRTIVSSILGSFKSLGWTVVLLLLIIYIVGVFFINSVTDHLVDGSRNGTQRTEGDNTLQYFFHSLPRTLMSLWQAMSGGADWDAMAGPLSDVHWLYGVAFSAYIAFALLALMNVVTGVFVQTALQNAKEEEDIFLTDQIVKLFEIQDRDKCQRIRLEEIQARLDHPDTAGDWKAINVQATEAKYLFGLLDIDESGEIDFEEFLGGCLRLHGTAKSFDLLTVMQENRSLAKMWSSHAEDLEHVVDEMAAQILAANSIASATSSELERVMRIVAQSQESVVRMDQRLRGQDQLIRRMAWSVDTMQSVLTASAGVTAETGSTISTPSIPLQQGGSGGAPVAAAGSDMEV